ncbi:flavin reductase [Pseudarthrobacter enclensis]|uniref:Flavin reductase (DIM6/NTAB) family NADH-FMN oxidoreductase RutF/predicted ester cyclase n=1 Tax=Pseudarthrobacter enclensis TaxID=993070 RepID=A0ABT9RTV3_9MICC|nr:flavin reductase [Pseudarthrobacter enclensis]MDP9888673.1 flavin reductase (DIM6/NTAB) family NADH-FMN oxidoreductase RutF/predicted ester cyclase [Pseudarthrobacter enclensis]
MPDFKELVRSVWDAAWNHGDPDALDAIVHPDYALENAESGNTSGLAELKVEVREMRAAIPDLRTTVDKIVVDNEDFAIFWSATGTFLNPLGDVPPTGRSLQTCGSVQGVLRDGRIIRERVTWDLTDDMLADLGAPRLRSAFEQARPQADFSEPTIDALKKFNRKFVTGVTVVTTTDSSGQPRGLTLSAYTPVSLDPPLVLVCVQKTSSTYPALFESDHLGINIIANTQRAVVDKFATKTDDKFSGLDWHAGPAGSPLIRGSAASMEAEIKERFQAKTHTVFIARVTHLEVSDLAPMLYVYMSGQFYDGASLKEL